MSRKLRMSGSAAERSPRPAGLVTRRSELLDYALALRRHVGTSAQLLDGVTMLTAPSDARLCRGVDRQELEDLLVEARVFNSRLRRWCAVDAEDGSVQ